ncbi:MAG: bifunctional pyr operon transcriptional regulator/uracil phosphoribosyltransferase PyrR [Candidatus Binatia bacterium]
MAKRIIVDGEELQRTVHRLAHEIIEKNGGLEGLVLVGILSRGAVLVRRIARKIEALSGRPPSIGIIDVTRYRDDIRKEGEAREPVPMHVPVSVEEKRVVLVDDVIYTGRTIRAALEHISQIGKPEKILVAILVDRGDRELPIKADIVGRNVQVKDSERVNVLLEELDGLDQVTVTTAVQRGPLYRKGI